MAAKRKLGIEYTFPITLVSLVGVWFVITLMLFFTGGAAVKLHKDIGATPWKQPELAIKINDSYLHKQKDISAAIDATRKLYSEEWYTYNGTYMLMLSYSDELNELKKDENEGEWIYLGAYMYTGYGNKVNPEDQGKYHKAYWAVEKQPDGSWLCHGCAPLDEDEYATACEDLSKYFDLSINSDDDNK